MKIMTDKERKAYRDALLREFLWSFFKPIVIGWGSFAVIAALLWFFSR